MTDFKFPDDIKTTAGSTSNPSVSRPELNDQTYAGPASTPLQETGHGQYGQTQADSSGNAPSIPSANTPMEFRIARTIGQGGMGVVYLAFDPKINRWIALKRMTVAARQDTKLLARFEGEGRSSKRLNHFHIVRTYSAGVDADGPFIAMEYVAGPLGPPDKPDWPNNPLNLHSYVKTKGPVSVEEAVSIGKKLCSALIHAHEAHRLIHRDIKPSNILLDSEFEPKLADFGLAREINVDEAQMTTAGSQLLTIGFGSPEQEIDSSKADHRADIYSLGATLWFSVTGQDPHQFRESEIPEILRGVIIKATAKDREVRFQTARDFSDALDKVIRGVTAIQDVHVGQCQACGHQHRGSDSELSQRKYCEQCGSLLSESCLQCSAPNPIWSKYCGSCAGDIVALTQAREQGLKEEVDGIVTLLEKQNFQEAIPRLRDMKTLRQLRLRQYVTWAEEKLALVEPKWSEIQQGLNKACEFARGRIAAGQETAAGKALNDIPVQWRNAEVNALIEAATAQRNEVEKLKKAIQSRASTPYYVLLKSAERLYQLRPEKEDITKLLSDVRRRYENEMAKEWTRVSKVRSIGALQDFLQHYPDSPHTEDIKNRISNLERVDHLKRQSIRGLGGTAVVLVLVGGFFLLPSPKKEEIRRAPPIPAPTTAEDQYHDLLTNIRKFPNDLEQNLLANPAQYASKEQLVRLLETGVQSATKKFLTDFQTLGLTDTTSHEETRDSEPDLGVDPNRRRRKRHDNADGKLAKGRDRDQEIDEVRREDGRNHFEEEFEQIIEQAKNDVLRLPSIKQEQDELEKAQQWIDGKLEKLPVETKTRALQWKDNAYLPLSRLGLLTLARTNDPEAITALLESAKGKMSLAEDEERVRTLLTFANEPEAKDFASTLARDKQQVGKLAAKWNDTSAWLSDMERRPSTWMPLLPVLSEFLTSPGALRAFQAQFMADPQSISPDEMVRRLQRSSLRDSIDAVMKTIQKAPPVLFIPLAARILKVIENAPLEGLSINLLRTIDSDPLLKDRISREDALTLATVLLARGAPSQVTWAIQNLSTSSFWDPASVAKDLKNLDANRSTVVAELLLQSSHKRMLTLAAKLLEQNLEIRTDVIDLGAVSQDAFSSPAIAEILVDREMATVDKGLAWVPTDRQVLAIDRYLRSNIGSLAQSCALTTSQKKVDLARIAGLLGKHILVGDDRWLDDEQVKEAIGIAKGWEKRAGPKIFDESALVALQRETGIRSRQSNLPQGIMTALREIGAMIDTHQKVDFVADRYAEIINQFPTWKDVKGNRYIIDDELVRRIGNLKDAVDGLSKK
jgi:serine/threonine protein kinase